MPPGRQLAHSPDGQTVYATHDPVVIRGGTTGWVLWAGSFYGIGRMLVWPGIGHPVQLVPAARVRRWADGTRFDRNWRVCETRRHAHTMRCETAAYAVERRTGWWDPNPGWRYSDDREQHCAGELPPRTPYLEVDGSARLGTGKRFCAACANRLFGVPGLGQIRLRD